MSFKSLSPTLKSVSLYSALVAMMLSEVHCPIKAKCLTPLMTPFELLNIYHVVHMYYKSQSSILHVINKP